MSFQSEQKSWNLLIFQFGQFQKLQIWKILKHFNLKNSKNINFENSKNINSENSKNLQCGDFEKFAISKILNISQIFQFRKTSNFWNFSISNINKFSKYYSLEKYQNSMNLQFYKLSYILNVRIIQILKWKKSSKIKNRIFWMFE